MKKFLICFIAFLAMATNAYSAPLQSGFVDYQAPDTNNSQQKEYILVLPVDTGYLSQSKSTYSSIINTMSGDIVNTLNKSSQIRALPLYNLNYKVKQNKLEPDLKRIIVSYKTKSVIDFRSLRTMCDVLHTNKVLLVSGDFDPAQFIFGPKNSLDLIPVGLIKPAYRIDTLMTLVDPQEEVILWEKVYKKSFTVNSPQTNYEHNAISVTGLKRFSQATAQNVLNNLGLVLFQPDEAVTTNVNSFVTTTNIQPKEGVTTKDGQTFSTNNKFVKTKKQKYSDWSDENL